MPLSIDPIGRWHRRATDRFLPRPATLPCAGASRTRRSGIHGDFRATRLIGLLQVQPNLRRARQLERRVGGHARLPVQDRRDPLYRHIQRLGQRSGRQPERLGFVPGLSSFHRKQSRHSVLILMLYARLKPGQGETLVAGVLAGMLSDRPRGPTPAAIGCDARKFGGAKINAAIDIAVNGTLMVLG